MYVIQYSTLLSFILKIIMVMYMYTMHLYTTIISIKVIYYSTERI